MRFCCVYCLNIDVPSFAEHVAATKAVVASLAQFTAQANAARQQITNDLILLKTIGHQTQNIGALVKQTVYNQGIAFLRGQPNIFESQRAHQNLYMLGEAANYLTNISPTHYQDMMEDVRNHSAMTMSMAGTVQTQTQRNLEDIRAIADGIANTTTEREDVQVNSRAREKLVALQQTKNQLLAQWIGQRARVIAARNQSDLSPPRSLR